MVVLQSHPHVAGLHIRFQRGLQGKVGNRDRRGQDRFRDHPVRWHDHSWFVFGLHQQRAGTDFVECELRQEGGVPARDSSVDRDGFRAVPRHREPGSLGNVLFPGVCGL